jgi:diacylglycerol kinase family enzyme
VVAGGDGTLASAAAALANQPTALAVLPAGTLNHFAQDLGIPTEPAAALEVALTGDRLRVDMGRVNERLFLNTSSVGAYVSFVRSRERWRRWLGYYLASAVAALNTFVGLRNFAVEIEIDGTVRSFRSPMVFLGQGERELQLPRLGARTPQGQRGFHVLIVRRTRRLGLIIRGVRALFTRVAVWGRARDVESMIVQNCRITLKRRHVGVAVDGEITILEGPLQYRYEPEVLTVIVPRATARGGA